MENYSGFDDQQMPPGFRFHPTDEELITQYLCKKVMDTNFFAIAIGEIDLNKVEPWDLPWKARMGEKEWYFFCLRDKKYPTGVRTNRATSAGYWKATGKDRQIFRGKSLVGMKKTLVFYRGRAPKGEKTNWVIHEFRLEGRLSLHNLPKTAKNEWVICRVFQKSYGGKKFPDGNEMGNSILSPLIDSGRMKPCASESSHVHCFSNMFTAQKKIQENSFNNPCFPALSNPTDNFPINSIPNSSENQGSFGMHDPAILESYGGIFKKEEQSTEIVTKMGERAVEYEEAPSAAIIGQEFLECLWNYSNS